MHLRVDYILSKMCGFQYIYHSNFAVQFKIQVKICKLVRRSMSSSAAVAEA